MTDRRAAEAEQSTNGHGARIALAVVGTGIQWAAQATLSAQRAISSAERVLFAVNDAWTADWIRSLNEHCESFSYPREGSPRSAIYEQMVQRVLSELREGHRVCAAFYGSPAVLARPAHMAIRAAREHGFPARMLPGVSFLDCLFADLGVDPGDYGLQLLEATDWLVRGRQLDAGAHVVLAQAGMLGNRKTYEQVTSDARRARQRLLGDALLRFYPQEHSVVVYEASSHPLQPFRADRIALAALPDVSLCEYSTLYIPPREQAPVDPSMRARLGLHPA